MYICVLIVVIFGLQVRFAGPYNTTMGSGPDSQPNQKVQGCSINGFIAVLCVMLVFYIYRKTRRITRSDLPGNCPGMRLYGVVTEISDGDGFWFFHCPWLRSRTYATEDDWIPIRLAGIKAPELSKQPFAKKSMMYLGSLIQGKNIKINVVGKDKYGRVLAFAYLPGWFLQPFLNKWLPIDFCVWFKKIDFLYTNVNIEMVKEGYARVYNGPNAKYDQYELTFRDLEKKAEEEKKGMWILPNPASPMEYKKNKLMKELL